MRAVIVILALLVTSVADAATVVVTASNLTAQETAATNWKLQQINAQRALAKLPAFASLKAYVEDYLTNTFLPQVVAEHAEADKRDKNIELLWKSATPAQRAAAITALGG